MFNSIITKYCHTRRRSDYLHYLLGFCMAVLFFPFHALSDESCGSLNNGENGPFDYYSPPPGRLQLVESHHFTPSVATLKSGNSVEGKGGVGADISYTLRAFPNHPRALMAIANLEFKEKASKPLGSIYSVPCWFSRALQFRPDDAQVNMIYGSYLLRKGERAEAITHLERAASLAPDNGNLQYNMGLAYFEAKDFEKSLLHAKRAYELGFDLPGLRTKLQKAGVWQ